MKLLSSCLLLLALLWWTPHGAMAHRVNVFAWIESGTVYVQAGFSRKNPARQSAVTVLLGTDSTGTTVLCAGTTDESGKFSFALPAAAQEHGLTIRVNAGQGHQNDWSMKAEECRAASPPASQQAKTQSASQPMPRMIDDGPRLRDIVGGLGWIVGLVGIGMALRSRKRNNR